MNLDARVEEAVKSKAMQCLQNGRPGFDIPHTLAAVYFMRELIKAEGGDERILVTAIYLHDIGYSGQIKNGYSYDEVIENKLIHVERGVAEAEVILTDLGYSPSEIEEIVYLIKNHDDFTELDKNEKKAFQLVFEADSLGQLDTPPTFKGKQYAEAFANFEEKRVPRFKTARGKQLLEPLLENARQRL